MFRRGGGSYWPPTLFIVLLWYKYITFDTFFESTISIICKKMANLQKSKCLRTQAIGITPRLLALSEGDGLVWKVKKFEFSSWNNFWFVAKRNNKEGLIDAIPPLLYIKWELSLKLYVNHQFTHRSLYRW